MATAYETLKAGMEAFGKGDRLKMAWDLIVFSDCWESIESRFSPAAMPLIREVYNMYIAELDAQWKLQESIDSQVAAHTTWFDDDAIDEVDAYAVVYSDRIEVTANVTGMGGKLPTAGRKYVGGKGDMRWAFPLSALAVVRPCVSFVLHEDGSLNNA
ncbi:MAG: hypothetical protein ACRC62_15410 [Microcoleus sp.]